MSVRAINAVFRIPPGVIETAERMYLTALADAADDDGFVLAFARSQSVFAFKCGWLNPESVRKYHRRLEAKGLIRTVELGSGRTQSSFQLTFLDDAPSISIGKVVRNWRNSKSSPQGSEGSAPSIYRGLTPMDEGGLISNHHVSSQQEKPSLARGLKTWFAQELWPRFPEAIGKHDAWQEVQLLNPDANLRRQIVEGLDRFLEAREREAAESTDGFVRALPSPRNFLRRRRWEDGR